MLQVAKVFGQPGLHPNLPRFLDLLAWCEATSTSRLTKDRGYDVVVSGMGIDGAETFTDYTHHPFSVGRAPKLIRPATATTPPLYSTASGRYQLLLRYYHPYCSQLHLTDFSPRSQDLIALQQIGERGAAEAIIAGRVEEAVHRCCNVWASLPGNGYGQGGKTVGQIRAYWEYLGKFDPYLGKVQIAPVDPEPEAAPVDPLLVPQPLKGV